MRNRKTRQWINAGRVDRNSPFYGRSMARSRGMLDQWVLNKTPGNRKMRVLHYNISLNLPISQCYSNFGVILDWWRK